MRVSTLAGESSHFGEWEFSLWRVRVTTAFGEISHRVGWEFSPQWVRAFNVVSESLDSWVRVSMWLVKRGWKFSLFGVMLSTGVCESLTVVRLGESCQLWVKVLAVYWVMFSTGVCGRFHGCMHDEWQFSPYGVRVFTPLGESLPCGEWKFGFAGGSLTVVVESCQLWVKVLTLWGDVIHWSMSELSLGLVYYVWQVGLLIVMGATYFLGWA